MQAEISFRNDRSTSIAFWLEPWAEEFHVAPGATLIFRCDFPKGTRGVPAVEITERFFVCWFGTGCRVRVFIDDADVTSPASWAIPAP